MSWCGMSDATGEMSGGSGSGGEGGRDRSRSPPATLTTPAVTTRVQDLRVPTTPPDFVQPEAEPDAVPVPAPAAPAPVTVDRPEDVVPAAVPVPAQPEVPGPGSPARAPVPVDHRPEDVDRPEDVVPVPAGPAEPAAAPPPAAPWPAAAEVYQIPVTGEMTERGQTLTHRQTNKHYELGREHKFKSHCKTDGDK